MNKEYRISKFALSFVIQYSLFDIRYSINAYAIIF